MIFWFLLAMENLKDSVVNKFLFIQISIHGFIKYNQVAFYWKNFSKQFLKKKKTSVIEPFQYHLNTEVNYTLMIMQSSTVRLHV